MEDRSRAAGKYLADFFFYYTAFNLLGGGRIQDRLRSELAEPDGAPLRIRLLGESLLAFRSTSGKIGLVAHNCPHRGASFTDETRRMG